MAWVRRDARDLHLRCMFYAAQHPTDGFIPEAPIGRFPKLKHQQQQLAARPVAMGLLEGADVGHLVHDWLNYNPPSNECWRIPMQVQNTGQRAQRRSFSTRDYSVVALARQEG